MRIALVLLVAGAAACRTGPLPSSAGPADLALPESRADLARSVGPSVVDMASAVDLAMRPRPCGGDQCRNGDVCQSTDGCCVCGTFAGYCLPDDDWTCAWPAENDPSCPAAEPRAGDACGLPVSIRCWYCGADGPRSAVCGTCYPDRSKADCWSVIGRTDHCD